MTLILLKYGPQETLLKKGAILSRWTMSSGAELQEPVSIRLKAKSAYLAI